MKRKRMVFVATKQTKKTFGETILTRKELRGERMTGQLEQKRWLVTFESYGDYTAKDIGNDLTNALLVAGLSGFRVILRIKEVRKK